MTQTTMDPNKSTLDPELMAMGAEVPINQNGVKPGPKRLQQFRDACLYTNLPNMRADTGKDPICRVKFFDPSGAASWYAIAWDRNDNLIFCWANLGDDEMAELGYTSLEELSTLKGARGIGIEIDNWWTPKPLSEVKAKPQQQTKEDDMDNGESQNTNHTHRFVKEIAPLLTPLTGTTEFQRIQAWIKSKTGNKTLPAFLSNGASDEEKKALLDELRAILAEQQWEKLPAAPSGQADSTAAVSSKASVIVAPPTAAVIQPKPASKPKVAKPVEPEPEQSDVPHPDAGKGGGGDPFEEVLASLAKIRAQAHSPGKPSITEDRVREIAAEVFREEITRVLGSLSVILNVTHKNT